MVPVDSYKPWGSTPQVVNQLVAYHAHERRSFSFQIVKPVLWSLLVLDAFDIRILDFVQVELGFLYHYA